MSMIRNRNTGPELMLRKILFSRGIRGYRIHANLPGKPDIVFTKFKMAIFIDGCFWHKCPKCFVTPSTRKNFWSEKIARNTERDKEVNSQLKNMGWKTIRFWEHEVRKNPEKIASKISMALK
jgi:DNA mismatch endonuclease (patch repair protein)